MEITPATAVSGVPKMKPREHLAGQLFGRFYRGGIIFGGSKTSG